MGDRANVLMKTDHECDSGVYFYTHWAGSNLPYTVQNALKRGEDRWDDPQYLGRIIFCEMIKDEVEGCTGYGISGFVGDGSNRIIKVDSDKETVTVEDQSWTFTEYIQLDLDIISDW